jgi:hypothetical protein
VDVKFACGLLISTCAKEIGVEVGVAGEAQAKRKMESRK